VTVGESAGMATLTVTLSAAPLQDVIVEYATADGGASAGQAERSEEPASGHVVRDRGWWIRHLAHLRSR
jgi:hypothetical protein